MSICVVCPLNLATDVLGRMVPDGCKMLFQQCMRDCEYEPVVSEEQIVRAADDECIKNCNERLETCYTSPVLVVNRRQIGSLGLSLGVVAVH